MLSMTTLHTTRMPYKVPHVCVETTFLMTTVTSILVIYFIVYVSALGFHVTAAFTSFTRRRLGHNFACVATNTEVTCVPLHFVLLRQSYRGLVMTF